VKGQVQTLELLFSGAQITADAHPNKMKLKGILVNLDSPSTKAPNGSDGHRILVPTDTAKRRLSSLVGMGLNYAPTLDGHAQKRKVGVITKAWIDGKNLWVEANIWKHDFPEAETDLKNKDLGMSMEIGDVHVEDPNATIWTLTDFYFLGATVLLRDKAAYYHTQAIAAAAAKAVVERSSNMKAKVQATKKPVQKSSTEVDAQKVAEIAATAAVEAVGNVLGPTIGRQASGLKKMTDILASITGRLETLELGTVSISAKKEDDEEDDEEAEAFPMVNKMTTKDDEDEDDEEASVSAAKKKMSDSDDDDNDDDDDDSDACDDMDNSIDEGNLAKMGPDTTDTADGDDDPGHLGDGAKNKGDKTTSEDRIGKNLNKAVTGAAINALRKQVQKLTQGLSAAMGENTKLKKRLSKYERQVSAAATEINRRSLSPELIGLLSKQGVNADDLRASGTKITAEDFDGIVKACGISLDVTKRIEFKNMLCKAGVMDEGRVNHGLN